MADPKQNPSPKSIFGGQKPGTTLFGNNQATGGSQSLFGSQGGQAKPGGLFSSGGNAFGGGTTFGAPAPSSGAQEQKPQSSPFGGQKPQTTSLFGSQGNNAGSQNAGGGGSLFGGSKPAEPNKSQQPAGAQSLFQMKAPQADASQSQLLFGGMKSNENKPKPTEAQTSLFGGKSEQVQKPPGGSIFEKKEEAKQPENPPQAEAKVITEAKPLSAEPLKDAPKVDEKKPVLEKQAEDKHVEHMRKWQEDFGKNSLSKISNKWDDQLKRNKQEFDKSSKQLQEYELKLIDQLQAIEAIQSTSATVVDQYKKNIRELTEVQTHQNVVIEELTSIEAELDKILPQYEDHYKNNFYNASESHRIHGSDESISLKETVFKQAQSIDASIDILDLDLKEVQQKIDMHQMKNDKEHKYRQLNIESSAPVYQRGRYGAEYPGQNSSVQAAQDIEKILGIYYDTLKWVQGSAIELEFQTKELEQKIHAHGQKQKISKII